jgi:hypothetical protein
MMTVGAQRLGDEADVVVEEDAEPHLDVHDDADWGRTRRADRSTPADEHGGRFPIRLS